jgi:hypothetical protein
MKTLSDKIFREEKTAKTTNSIAKNIFSLTKSNFGENIFTKIR